MVDSHDISVVVQGPIVGKTSDPLEQRFTYKCLKSIRRHMPGAEIVLSTWKGSDLTDLCYDLLVESQDPGGWNIHKDPDHVWLNNVGRQITTTKAGLEAATRPYAMKIRSDMLLTGTGFLNYFGKYRERNAEWKILHERVVTPTVYAMNPRRYWAFPFHPSDCFHFGLREDVLDIWDIPLPIEPENSRWFDTHPMPDDHAPDIVYRYNPEQYIWVSFLRKHGEVPFLHRSDLSPNTMNLSELTIANNLVVAEPAQLQIVFLKFAIPRVQWASIYTHGEWLRLCKNYCDQSLSCPLDLLALQKKAYVMVLWPVHGKLAHTIFASWKTMSPASFNLVKRAYVALFNRTTEV